MPPRASCANCCSVDRDGSAFPAVRVAQRVERLAAPRIPGLELVELRGQRGRSPRVQPPESALLKVLDPGGIPCREIDELAGIVADVVEPRLELAFADQPVCAVADARPPPRRPLDAEALDADAPAREGPAEPGNAAVRAIGQPQRLEDRRPEVEQSDEAGHAGSARPRLAGDVLRAVGKAEDQRHAGLLAVHVLPVAEPEAVLTQGLPVIGGEHDQGVHPQSALLEVVDQPPELLVEAGDLGVVARAVDLRAPFAVEDLVGRDLPPPEERLPERDRGLVLRSPLEAREDRGRRHVGPVRIHVAHPQEEPVSARRRPRVETGEGGVRGRGGVPLERAPVPDRRRHVVVVDLESLLASRVPEIR